MKISISLPQFQNRRALLIVTGDWSAKFFLAGSGTITKLTSFVLRKPSYSDREGFFGHGLRGSPGSGAGSAYEAPHIYMQQEFKKSFASALRDVKADHEFEDIYLFAPETKTPALLDSLDQHDRKKVRQAFSGNFFKLAPGKLLEKIAAYFDETVGALVPRRREAHQILARSIKPTRPAERRLPEA